MPKNANTTELAMERQFLKTAWKIFGWDLCIVASLFKEKKKKKVTILVLKKLFYYLSGK